MLEIFPPNLNNEIDSIKIKHAFSKKQIIFKYGENPEGLYFLKKGLVGLVYSGSGGSEHLLRLFKAGQFFGHRSFFANEAYHANAVCLESSEIYFLDKKSIHTLISTYPEFSTYFLNVLAIELRQSENHRVSITEKDVLQRAAAAIVYLFEISPDHKWTRQEIAEYCESTPTTIVKTLSKLEDMGLIEQLGHRIKILKREELLNL
jgi:CRP-like cAMP-binding protein